MIHSFLLICSKRMIYKTAQTICCTNILRFLNVLIIRFAIQIRNSKFSKKKRNKYCLDWSIQLELDWANEGVDWPDRLATSSQSVAQTKSVFDIKATHFQDQTWESCFKGRSFSFPKWARPKIKNNNNLSKLKKNASNRRSVSSAISAKLKYRTFWNFQVKRNLIS